MRTRYLKFMSVLGMMTLALALAPCATALCGLATKPIKPAGLRPQYGGAHPALVLAGLDDEHEASIVGMWHVIFTAETMNGDPFSGVIDNAVVVWHSDGTEIMNSARPAQDGNFCLGVWTQTGKNKYFLNHIPWLGNDTANAPGGIGNPQGGVQIIEKIDLKPDGNSYCGTFKLQAYDTAGNVTVTFTGVLKAKRITVDTPFSDLL